ncbi:MAG: GNAT family acetyltransferase [Pseudomonadota bacterium]
MDFELRRATANDERAVVSLWETCGLVAAHNPPNVDFQRALNAPSADIIVAHLESALVGSAMVGDDGHRGWIYYLAVAPEFQRTGLGRELCAACETWAGERGLCKIQLMIRPSNESVASFYAAAGYEETPRLVMAKWLDT